MTRPRPVLILAALMAALSAVAGAGAMLDFLPQAVVATILLVNVAVAAAGGVIVQGSVTPLSAPQAADGSPLVSQTTAELQKTAARIGASVALQHAERDATLQE
jgi:hypothetical protein